MRIRKFFLCSVLAVFCILLMRSDLFSAEKNSRKVQDYLEPVPFTEVSFNDEFWLPRLQTNRKVTVPHIFNKLEETGRIDNFAIAGGLKNGKPRYHFPFDDTDIYKTLEGASYSLMVSPDQELENYLDELIELIAAAQEEDGYLYTVRTNSGDIWSGKERWSYLSMSHELYNAGHLFEAAIAHYQATGKKSLLNVAVKFADLLVETFHESGVEIPPGHEIVESGLARLSDVTGNRDYLELARYFVDIRGRVTEDYEPWGEYHQDHKPVLQQEEAKGHVVRALYLYIGMADIASRIPDSGYSEELMDTLVKIWHSINDTKMYITGGLGAKHGGESFGRPYELPNDGYCETCAQIANVMWNQRMFLRFKEGRYIDSLERSLYNSLISGVSLQGDTFFYPNPLVSSGGYSRSSWFECNCCIGNIARTIPSIPGYVYARSEDGVWVNLFIPGKAGFELSNTQVEFVQKGGYPWKGNISIEVSPKDEARFTVYLRIPGWARNKPVPSSLYRYKEMFDKQPELSVNGKSVPLKTQKGYAAISRKWKSGDKIELNLPMKVRKVLPHPNIKADRGRIAMERGPIVYCAEWPDFNSKRVTHLYIPENAEFKAEYRKDMLGLNGVADKGCVLTGTVKGLFENEKSLAVSKKVDFTAIPYYAWAHRGEGQMAVWLPEEKDLANPIPKPTVKKMLGHWKLEEESGTAAKDSSGQGGTGKLADGLSFDEDSKETAAGSCLHFDGTGDYIKLPEGFDDFVKGCTISVWAYPTAVNRWARFVDLGSGAASDNIFLTREADSNNLIFDSFTGASSSGLVRAEDAVELNEWQMFTAAAGPSGNAKLFKNGKLIADGKIEVSNIKRTRNFIGKSNWSADENFQGLMDDVRIYNYGLSDSQVKQLYKNTKPSH
ncbi:hypothetical protein L21SP3_00560 [Sedimentisphaera cyanobacteriorum]|uniref:Non-reducing end beta-L-arabinofuranosidase n=1 Tax=Sedimentisphaera cyanobacteriorum TaxID=1940790 RepID=A0A1Q2HN36_9BACT|nr:beta-L-arabinofuranosidase domain-containing protein [Sedimentisphaera cyanobacteriorum]AQQ08770.1 hypothetical protein L21SP3_00560 [Sedimentisphaera cyanobacteriorum]